MENMSNKSSSQALILVLISIALGIVSALCLNEIAQKQHISFVVLVVVIGIAVLVNAGRFLLWGYIHKHYPISLSYPLNSLFFPLIFIIGYFYGEPVNNSQILGVILITSGVAILSYDGKNND